MDKIYCVTDLYHRHRSSGSGLTILPKIKMEHVVLTSYSKMRVNLAVQVSCASCACSSCIKGVNCVKCKLIHCEYKGSRGVKLIIKVCHCNVLCFLF